MRLLVSAKNRAEALAAAAAGADFIDLKDPAAGALGALPIEHIAAITAALRAGHPAHEEHAVSIADGYGKVTEEPMAVALHSNVGLMHASMCLAARPDR